MTILDQIVNHSITTIKEMMKTKLNLNQYCETIIQDQTQEEETHQLIEHRLQNKIIKIISIKEETIINRINRIIIIEIKKTTIMKTMKKIIAIKEIITIQIFNTAIEEI